MHFYFVERYQGAHYHKFCELFNGKQSPTSHTFFKKNYYVTSHSSEFILICIRFNFPNVYPRESTKKNPITLYLYIID